jgi:ATP-dependent exoDNAse (exonuclease V) beta subunit
MKQLAFWGLEPPEKKPRRRRHEQAPPPPAPTGRTEPPLTLDEATRRRARDVGNDLVLRAGAGTGKTHTLVGVFSHLVAGATALRRRVVPGRVLMLTFSEKAAAEMRERVRARFAALAADPRSDRDLTDAYERMGTQPLDAHDWRAAAAALSGAPITTFHGFAAGLLRRHAAAAALDPSFEVLDEEDASTLLRTRAEEVVLGGLDRPRVRELVRELDFSQGVDSRGRGLVEHVIDLAQRLAEEGRHPEALALAGDDPRWAENDFEQGKEELASALEALVGELRASRKSPRTRARTARLANLAGGIDRTLALLDIARDPVDDPEIRAIAREIRGNLGTEPRNAERRRLAAALRTLREAHVAHRAVPLEGALVSLVAEVLQSYHEAKQARGALDFSDLMTTARALLAADTTVRAEEQERADAVLVDELQDTNDLQDELIGLARGPGVPLLAVGDPKQSIY